MTATAERPVAPFPLRPNGGSWRNQVDALLTPVEREITNKLAEARAEVARLEHELVVLRSVKHSAGVSTEVKET